ncbi:hypothetical protein EVAR_21409_1 [Eumeta japonica]|uniref:Uncharacterized protein n=1 Tax=Eumeta variegata TaxID=151549 RepID=A0A4C1VIY8_EUMVA|nr:hypothetical protein EVAR_21409_1 [Eumeta japonica]
MTEPATAGHHAGRQGARNDTEIMDSKANRKQERVLRPVGTLSENWESPARPRRRSADVIQTAIIDFASAERAFVTLTPKLGLGGRLTLMSN